MYAVLLQLVAMQFQQPSLCRRQAGCRVAESRRRQVRHTCVSVVTCTIHCPLQLVSVVCCISSDKLKLGGYGVVPFPLLRGDCGRRGWYDYPVSAEALYSVAQCAFTPDVCKLVCEWGVCDSARGRCVLCRRDLVAICL